MLKMRAAVLTSVILLVGCSGGGNLDTAPVTGVVTLDGKPVTSGLVRFWPEGGRTAEGYLGDDGKFVLRTYEDADGATLGTHKVTVTHVSNEKPQEPDYDKPEVFRRRSRDKPPIPLKYDNPEASGLTFEVKAGEENFAELKLSS